MRLASIIALPVRWIVDVCSSQLYWVMRAQAMRRQQAKEDALVSYFGSRESLNAWQRLARSERENLLFWREIQKLQKPGRGDELIRVLLVLSDMSDSSSTRQEIQTRRLDDY